MSKSLLVAFRLPSAMVDDFLSAVEKSEIDRTAWIIEAIAQKLEIPDNSLEKRLIPIVERLERASTALIVGKMNIPTRPYNESAVLSVVIDTMMKGITNGRIISERINEAGYQTMSGKAWDKDIYSAWRRKSGMNEKISDALFVAQNKEPSHHNEAG